MAQLTKLNTRIRLRYDELDNWLHEDPVLYKGEVAVVSVPAQQNAETGLQETPPAILFKVGDGETEFSELPWGSALAADVYAWAKAAERPTYYASDITLSANDNTTVASQLTSLQTEVNTLTGNNNNGGTSIAQLITAAIENLDGGTNTGSAGEGKYVSAVTQEDGLVSVTYSDFPAEYDDTEVWAAIHELYQAGTTTTTYVAADGTYVDGTTYYTDNTGATEVDTTGFEVGVTDVSEYFVANSFTSAATGKVAVLEGKMSTLIGSDTGKSVRTIANEELAAQLIPENAQASLDSLQEIAAWIQEHPGDAAAMNAAIQALQAKTVLGNTGATQYVKATGTYVDDTTYYTDNTGATEVDTTSFTAGETSVEDYYVAAPVEYATVKAYVEAAIASLNIGNYALAADLTALADRVLANETAIGNMDYEVATTPIAQADQDEEEFVNVLTGFSVADGQLVSSSVNEVTLAKVATTGSINDLIQDLILELDGGDAAGDPSDPLVPEEEPNEPSEPEEP